MELDLTKLSLQAPYVLVKRCKRESVSPGGIVIPEETDHLNRTCEVIAVHPGRKFSNGTVVPCEVSPGQLVEFMVFDPIDEFRVDGVEYEVANEAEILASWEAVNV